MFKKDSWILGLALGIGIPAILYGILHFVNIFIANQFNHGFLYVQESTVMLICIFMNMFSLRYYLVKKKFDKTGRAILAITFVYAGLFFYFFN